MKTLNIAKSMCMTVALAAALTVPTLTVQGGSVANALPTVEVQAGAAARSAPRLNGTFVGWVLNVSATGGKAYGAQPSLVQCWKDGDWATGNYRSNRWFKVYVYESTHGIRNPQWLFVHSSFVTNQKKVGRC